MTQPDMRALFLEELTRISPDIDPADVSDSDHLQDDLELDSMDILNLVTALHQRLGVSISEADYPKIATPGFAVSYLSDAAGSG
ncbi:acyl carrier protein [Leisingera aquimarina]|uniref:acyl carrier protein n=1 Tax=Leisingera aquimarina TaxID=476529 RepID=UPI0004183A7E|nr:acyl carrier protein [Leisingera aquimarina]